MSERILQNLFLCKKAYLDSTPQPLKNRKAISSITSCRTPALGSNVYTCPDAHETRELYHSCRHRSCQLCAQQSRVEWIEKQQQRIFDCPHFHVIFTLPHEYLSLWRFNEAAMSRLLFRAVQETLMTLLSDPQYGGITPGVLMALHTWGRQLSLHPHIHCLVSAGGVNTEGHWQETGPYLPPVQVVKTLYRGKFQALLSHGLREGEIALPSDLSARDYRALHQAAWAKSWCVRIEPRYDHGKGVALYLARYCKGGPLNPKQIQACSAESISMRYFDHRAQRTRTLRMDTEGFIQRLLQHVPPQGLHTVRYAGLYAPAAKRQHQRFSKQLGVVGKQSLPCSEQLRAMVLYCQHCGSPMPLSFQRWRPLKGNSINKEDANHRASDFVQQRDQADQATPGWFSSA